MKWMLCVYYMQTLFWITLVVVLSSSNVGKADKSVDIVQDSAKHGDCNNGGRPPCGAKMVTASGSKDKNTTKTSVKVNKQKKCEPVEQVKTVTVDSASKLDLRLAKLEELIATQQQGNMDFKNSILSALSMEAMEEQYYDYEEEEEEFPSGQPGPACPIVPGMDEDMEIASGATQVLDTNNNQLGFASCYVDKNEGPPLDVKLVPSLKFLLGERLNDKALQETLAKYEPPENVPELTVPKVNSTIWDSMNPKSRSNDLKMQRIQRGLVKGLTAMCKSLSTPSESEGDALACFAHANFELNMLRREFIKPDLNPQFAHLCRPSVPVTQSLFGDDLSKQVKEMNDVQQVANKLSKFKNTNSKRYRPYPNRGRGAQRAFLGQGQNRYYKYDQNQYQYQQPRRGRGRGRGGPKVQTPVLQQTLDSVQQ